MFHNKTCPLLREMETPRRAAVNDIGSTESSYAARRSATPVAWPINRFSSPLALFFPVRILSPVATALSLLSLFDAQRATLKATRIQLMNSSTEGVEVYHVVTERMRVHPEGNPSLRRWNQYIQTWHHRAKKRDQTAPYNFFNVASS